jgi:hypothetical protein
VNAWELTALQARMLWRMLFGQVSVRTSAGRCPSRMAGESAMAGVSAFLWFLVLISLALGFANLLPIPILDGGQIVMRDRMAERQPVVRAGADCRPAGRYHAGCTAAWHRAL